MGAGSVVRQYKRRFHRGESVSDSVYPVDIKGKCDRKVPEIVKDFGIYIICKTEDEDYELLKRGESVGWFSVAVVEDDRVLFALSQGIQLEVSKLGLREILTSEKAELCGLIGSDGGIYPPHYEIHFISVDRELIERFHELFKKVYNIEPHLYSYKKREGAYFESRVYNRGVYFDLWDLNTKPGAFIYRVPLKHLDREGLKAYLRGFFTGDGNISKDADRFKIRIHSSCKEGLEELRRAFELLKFYPKDIRMQKKGESWWRDRYYFSIPVDGFIQFIREIGTYHPGRLERLGEVERRYKGRKTRDKT